MDDREMTVFLRNELALANDVLKDALRSVTDRVVSDRVISARSRIDRALKTIDEPISTQY